LLPSGWAWWGFKAPPARCFFHAVARAYTAPALPLPCLPHLAPLCLPATTFLAAMLFAAHHITLFLQHPTFVSNKRTVSSGLWFSGDVMTVGTASQRWFGSA
jgi:hypothetical protein